MANLSNINNILRVSSSGVGLNKNNTGPSELDIESSGADMIDMTRTGQKTYRFAISGTSAFSLFDVAANADRLIIDSSGNATFAGNVKLTDEKILGLRTSTNDYALQYRDLDFRLIGSADGTTQRKFSFGYYTSDNPAGTWNGKTYINSYTGNVGINIATPGFQSVDGYGQIGIEIKGGKENNQAPCIRLHETGSGKGSFELRSTRNILTSGNYFAIAEGTDTFFAIRGDDDGGGVGTRGHVGIGTISPSAKLEVVTAVGGDAIRLNFGQSADIFLGFNSANPRILLQDNSNVVTHNFQSNGDNYIVNSNVGIGQTSPSFKLDVNGTGYFSDLLRVDEPVYSYTDSGTKHYTHLATGSLYGSGASAMIVTTNIPGHNQTGNANMFSFNLVGYSYAGYGMIDMTIGVYAGENNYYSASWTGTCQTNWIDDIYVYTDTNGKVAFQIGTVTDQLLCEIAATNFVQGFANVNEDYSKGWSIVAVTTLPTQSNTTSVPYKAILPDVYEDVTFHNKVGIGTTSPQVQLHIDEDTSNSYAKLRLEGANRGGILQMYNGGYPVSAWSTDQSGNMSFDTSGGFAGTSLSTRFSIATNGATTQTMDSTTSLSHLWSQGVPVQNVWYTVYTYSQYDSVCFFAMVSFENDAGDGANQSAMFATGAGAAYGAAFAVEQISGGTGIEARRSSTSFQVRQTIGAYTNSTRLNVRFVSIN